MKKQITNTLVLSSLFLSVHATASIDFPHVDSYDSAGVESLWKDVKGDTVPNALITRSTIDNPGASYSRLFPKSFLQEELFAVCYQDCSKKDTIKISGSSVQANDKDSIEQANVYYWLKHYFSFLDQRFNFRPAKSLKVMTNRSIKDPSAGKKMKNNAFFNPADTTLSFLPASNSWLYNAMNGKINRSGYDVSVISHEASHFFFQHLFPDAINYEISGLNEGFADYIANLHINNPKVGVIMMRGKALRDAGTMVDGQGRMKIYEPKLEAHDLGERVAAMLWSIRGEMNNPEEYDRQIVDSVRSMAQNPFATAHSLKTELVKRLPSLISDEFKLQNVKNAIDISLPGQEAKVSDTSFLSKNTNVQAYLGFKINQTIAKNFADEMGLDVHNNLGFSFLREEKLNNGQSALLVASDEAEIANPYWYVIDAKSNNILGIYSADQRLVTDKAELKKIEDLTSQVTSQNETITDFISKTRMFSDLAQGKGDLTSGYKIKSQQTIADTMDFNNEPTAIERTEISLKKKFLLSLIVGLPDISNVTVYAANKPIAALPQLNGKTVIGYKLQFENGTSTEMILNKYGKQQN